MLKLIVLIFIIIRIKSQTDWGSYITLNTLNDVQLELRYGQIYNTNGLENFPFITYLDLSNNFLKNLGQIKYLIHLTFIDINTN